MASRPVAYQPLLDLDKVETEAVRETADPVDAARGVLLALAVGVPFWAALLWLLS